MNITILSLNSSKIQRPPSLVSYAHGESAAGGPNQIVRYAVPIACDRLPRDLPAVSLLMGAVQPRAAVTCRLLDQFADRTAWSTIIRSAGVSRLATINATLDA